VSGRRIIVTSAAPPNGDGYGAALAFDLDGRPLGVVRDDPRIADPRGLRVDATGELLYLNSADRVLALDADGGVVHDSGPIPGLNPGGANFGPDGRLYVGLRTARTITAFSATLAAPPEPALPEDIVPFPRGFDFASDGRLYLASGIGPTGQGARTIAAFSPNRTLVTPHLVHDPDLSPLDLLIAPNGDIIVASEHPFGTPDAVTTVRQYDAATGRLVRIFRPDEDVPFRQPRGLRIGPDGNLFCVAQDDVVAFDFTTGACLGTVVRYPNLNGQALEFF
jgi:DNA-binding beta-propeller fold protein YncE